MNFALPAEKGSGESDDPGAAGASSSGEYQAMANDLEHLRKTVERLVMEAKCGFHWLFARVQSLKILRTRLRCQQRPLSKREVGGGLLSRSDF